MRLFVAVRPAAHVLDALERLPRDAPSSVRWTTRDQWHVTLRFLGDVEDPAPVLDAVLRAVAGAGATAVELGPRAVKLGADVIVLPVRGLDDVATAVTAATRDVGVPPARRAFRGHVTLARTRGGPVDLAPLRVEESWLAHDVEVVRSHLGRGGARYETLGRIPF